MVAIARLVALSLVAAVVPAQSYTNFESSQTDPIAISADGLRLFALNGPDGRLGVYSLADPDRPVLIREIRVGLEPVSVRQRTRDEVWVVNQLSDSVSVVSLRAGRVVATIPVGDEPGDVVFAGTPQRAFVSVQTDREVRVFDVRTRQQIGTVPIFGDDPKALTASADGRTVWVAVLRSGNGTTLVSSHDAPPPPPPTNQNLPPAPQQGIIVKAEDPTWSAVHGVVLPDHDVIEIDALTFKPRRAYSSVGTILFNLVERPRSPGEIWVAQTAARNTVRFEPVLRGHAIDSQVARIVTGPARNVTIIDLNPQIDYNVLPNDAALRTALSQPTDLAFNPRGDELYVAAFGTDRVGVVDMNGNVVARIEIGPGTGTTAAPRQKRGPRALAHHPTQPRLYVLNTISNSLTVVDTAARAVLRELGMVFDPTPSWLKEGRGFLYDAKLSGNGSMACASCHVDGVTDNLAWDLGDPGAAMESGRGADGVVFQLHPMKGPMLTQTLQGLANMAPLHWRGDKTGVADFNVAFNKLMGRTPLAQNDLDTFVRFAESIVHGANPKLHLDRSLPSDPPGLSAVEGRDFFVNTEFAPGAKCVDCHSLTTGSNRVINSGQILQRAQPFKTAQLRNVYERTGKKRTAFGRIAGFGNAHDGEFDSVFGLLSDPVFRGLSTDTVNKTRLMRFVEAFDNGTAPAVGFTLTTGPSAPAGIDVGETLRVLRGQVRVNACDLIARRRMAGREVGYFYNRFFDRFEPDQAAGQTVTFDAMVQLAEGGVEVLTFMGLPRNTGHRVARDRDVDGIYDGDELPTSYGNATPACASDLEIAANSPADLGNEQFALVTRNANPGTPAWTLLGFAPTSLTILGVDLLVDMTTGFAYPIRTDRDGIGILPLPIPSDPNLRGGALYFQTIVADPCAPNGFAGTHGLRVTLGL